MEQQVCIFCVMPVESTICRRCGEYKGIMGYRDAMEYLTA